MNNNIDSFTPPPWYKQFWPWFLIALPGSVVIASIFTVIIAFESADTVVTDNYYKEGLAINRDLSRQQLAEKMNVKAQMQLNHDKLRLQISSDANKAETLLLRFVHPTLADLDQQTVPTMIAPGVYQASISPLINGAWNVILLSTSANWEVSERIIVKDDQVLYTIR